NDSKKLDEARKKLSKTLRDLKNQTKRAETSNHDVLMKFGYNGYGKENAIPIVHITQAACDTLLKATLKKTLSDIEAEIDKSLKPQSAVLTGWTVKGETAVERVREEVKNVVGVIEAEGPLANETIVIGAHYDHLGLGKYGSLSPGVKEVHNGADDNGSGTAGLLELARRFAARKVKLPRRIVFIAFTAEELGLIGSARYVKNPVFPLENTIAMFNMDMIGRMKNNKLIVFGSGTSPRWQKVLERYNEDSNLGLELTFKPEGFGPSDHSSFYGKKIPVLHFFTGIHNDYHRPSDDWEKINVEGMQRVVDLLEDIIVATAETKERPQYVAVKGRANIQRSGSRPYFGSIPDFSSEQEGYSLSGVGPGSPAEKGGLKGGDSIIEFGKNKITDLSDFDLALRKFSAGDVIEVTVLRNGKKVKLKVTLSKPK
ncbi:MAG: M20/M25/M40 family metallo-hydrolase, partial [Planctomycetes bacterium]|nr:M20/M25/M40 family metallo-hydrolase [Planctomycetota bacterium]